ncbi:MAG: ASKHA domain-containing protein [Clostridium sp.]|jgi:uncharacterized 2Fe-2S/4Fe-4S cluster protein (DUF4445 family)|nr:ASKHA domain-containing protein [Clostridium sp.]
MELSLNAVRGGDTIYSALRRQGVQINAPCGGNGSCGKCLVTVDGKELLACQTPARPGMRVALPNAGAEIAVRAEGQRSGAKPHAVAIDLGSTTLAVAVLAEDGTSLVQRTELNEQRCFGADVLSRLQAAANGEAQALTRIIREQINRLCQALLGAARVENTVVAGNTAMLHLLFGADTGGLGTYPYSPAFLAAQRESGAFFGWEWTEKVLTPPCLHAFCGADITAGLLTLLERPRPFLLADLGTNAELALCVDGGILVSSAAAGPVFEGAGISCGMNAMPGAICGFSLLGERASYSTIGGAAAVGICASGLFDVLAQLRRSYRLSAQGRLAQDYKIAPNVVLTQADVRVFQTAKAAIAAGIQMLCAQAGIAPHELKGLAVAGSLGSALRTESAVKLGVFGGVQGVKITAEGDTALAGAVQYALSADSRALAEKIAAQSRYVDLSLLPDFERALIANMDFPPHGA